MVSDFETVIEDTQVETPNIRAHLTKKNPNCDNTRPLEANQGNAAADEGMTVGMLNVLERERF